MIRSILILLLVILYPGSILGQDDLSPTHQYRRARERYLAARVAAANDNEKALASRDVYRRELKRVLDQAAKRGFTEYDNGDLATLVRVANYVEEPEQVVKAFRGITQTHPDFPALQRIALRAHIDLGQLDVAETKLDELKRMEPSNPDVNGPHIAMAEAYLKAGRREKAAAHLERFMLYVVDSLGRLPALALSMPSLLARYKHLHTEQSAAFLGVLEQRIVPAVKSIESRDVSNPAALEQLNAVYCSATAVAVYRAPDDVSALLTQWTEKSASLISLNKRLSQQDSQHFIRLVRELARFSQLMRSSGEIRQLRESVKSLEAALPRRVAGEADVLSNAMRELDRFLEERDRFLEIIGSRLSPETMNELGIQAGSIDSPVLILSWSPVSQQATRNRNYVKSLLSEHNSLRIIVVFLVSGEEAGMRSTLECELAESGIPIKEGRVTVSAMGSHANTPKQLKVGVLPQLVLLDDSLAIRNVMIGADQVCMSWLSEAVRELERPQEMDKQSAAAVIVPRITDGGRNGGSGRERRLRRWIRRHRWSR
jgi:tetratricopeptide (TPR) repeat protein